MLYKNPLKYLSSATAREVSMSLGGHDDEVDRHAFILKDGTVITVEKARDTTIRDSGISNPNNVAIVGPSRVIINYIINPEHGPEEDDQYEHVALEAKSMIELEREWIKYRRDRALPDDTRGIISELDYTGDQEVRLTSIQCGINTLLNLMTDTTVPNDMERIRGGKRYELIKAALTEMMYLLMRTRETDRLHIPCKKINGEGVCVEISEYTTTSMLFQQ